MHAGPDLAVGRVPLALASPTAAHGPRRSAYDAERRQTALEAARACNGRAWRERVPFAVPFDPCFMSYEPRLAHSHVTRDCEDRGVAFTPAPTWSSRDTAAALLREEPLLAPRGYVRRPVVALDADVAHCALSLGKRSLHHRLYS